MMEGGGRRAREKVDSGLLRKAQRFGKETKGKLKDEINNQPKVGVMKKGY